MATRKEITIARRAMACDFSLTFPAEERHAVETGCAALNEVERLEARLSAYRDDSDLSYLNRHAALSRVVVSPELLSLLTLTARLAAETGGAFDPAAGALVRVWGFLRPPCRAPSDEERGRAVAASGMARVEIDAAHRHVRYLCPDVEINFGGVGKGYAIDRALEAIHSRRALMQGGQSSLRARGEWRVALGDPFRPGRAMAAVRLRDRALGTSAATHRYFFAGGRRYGHVLDPRTGWPADTLVSASAVAPSAAEADALSTAFFVMGVDATRRYCSEHREVGAVLLTKPEPGRPPQLRVIGSADVEMLQ